MAGLTLNYSRRDPDLVLQDIKAQLITISNGEWSDFLESDIGYMFLKSEVVIGDFDSFFVDANLAECFISTALLRESVIRIAKLLGYQPKGLQPATVQVQISFPAFSALTVIPANSVWTIAGLSFTCIPPISIPAGQTSVNATLVQGTPWSSGNLSGTGINFAQIKNIPVNLSNLSVSVNGTVWTQIDSFTSATLANSFKVYEDSNGALTITFGGNTIPYRPNLNDVIVVSGILTAGAAGNIDTQGIAANLSTRVTVNGTDITNDFTGVTISTATGGVAIESTDSIRSNAPQSYSTQDRGVNEDDWNYLAKNFPGIQDAIAIGGERVVPAVKARVLITVLGSNPYSNDPDLLANLNAYLAIKAIAGITPIAQYSLILKAALTLNIGVDPKVYSDLVTPQNLVVTAVSNFFAGFKLNTSMYSLNLDKAVGAIAGITSEDCLLTVTSTGNSSAGLVRIPIAANVDWNTAVLKDASGNTLYPLTGQTPNWTQYQSNGQLVYTQVGLANQVCSFTSGLTSNNIKTFAPLGQAEFILLDSLVINPSFVSNP